MSDKTKEVNDGWSLNDDANTSADNAMSIKPKEINDCDLPSVKAGVELRDLIMRNICEGDESPEIEDAVNTCYDYIYSVVTRTLLDNMREDKKGKLNAS